MQSILNNYMAFFSLHEMAIEIFTLSGLGIILTLALMEGLLSVDNSVVLAALVKHLPEAQRKKALFYGLWGAYLFRFIAIGLGTLLVKIWWVKILAAAYLLYISVHFFLSKKKDEEEKTLQTGFWATIFKVEAMDIAFSVDSVTASFGVSDKVWVLFVGAMFGILMMRGIAQLFVKLINSIPEFEGAAYALIGVIAAKMFIETCGIEIHDLLFFGLIILVFGEAIALHFYRKNKMEHRIKA